jgi:hypothetical protein
MPEQRHQHCRRIESHLHEGSFRHDVILSTRKDAARNLGRFTGEIIATNHIDPERTYWRNTMTAPGRWPKGAYHQ